MTVSPARRVPGGPRQSSAVRPDGETPQAGGPRHTGAVGQDGGIRQADGTRHADATRQAAGPRHVSHRHAWPAHPAGAEHPAAGHPAAGHPGANHPSAGHPAAGHPAAGHPAAGHPAAAEGPACAGAPPGPIAELADRLAGDVLDAHDVVEALGVDDREARDRYGQPSAHALGVSVIDHLRGRRATEPHSEDQDRRERRATDRRGSRRAARRRVPRRPGYLASALLRCALYLGPLSVAVAAARSLHAVAWPVPAAALVLGWTAAQALTGVGAEIAGRQGRPAAARLVGGGFAATGGLWCALVWVAPAGLLGPDRWLAGTVGVGALASLATVTAALVTRAEAAVIRWSLPCWLLAAVSVAATVGDGWASYVPTGTLLPAAITVAAVRAYRPVIGRSLPRRPPLDRAVLRRGWGYLLIGAAQAACVLLLWRAGPPGATSPAALPLLAAVPVLEALVGWHIRQVSAGLDRAETEHDFRRHVRGVTIVTIAGLLPPLAAGAALAAGAYRLPYGPSTREGVLALAAGTLLGGVFAATFLLAARRRTVIAASLAVAAPAAIAALPLLPASPSGRLPAIVAVFAATHLVGLLAVALTASDHRRTS